MRKAFLRNPKFKEIRPNYRRRVFEITLREGRTVSQHVLPFSLFEGMQIGPQNRVASVTIDREINSQGAFFTLEDGSNGSFPADFVLYHCDSSYDWSPINQIRRKLQGKLGRSKLAVQVVADAFRKSSSQVLKLLEEHRSSQYLGEVLRLADLAGYPIALKLKKKPAA